MPKPSVPQKINIAKEKIQTVGVSGWFSKESRVADLFSAWASDQGFYMQTRTYRRDHTPHWMEERAFASPDSEDRHIFYSLEYTLSSPFQSHVLPDVFTKGSFLFDSIKDLAINGLSGNVEMRFDESDSELESLFFPLPIPYERPIEVGNQWPMDELRGIRGIRYHEDTKQVAYNFILERPLNQTIYLSLDLQNFESHTLTGSIDHAISEATTIALNMGLPCRIQRKKSRKE